MWVSIGLIVAVLFVALFLKHAFGAAGPSPFDTDTREPPKPVQLDKKERNKVLKQGECLSLYQLFNHIYFVCSLRVVEIIDLQNA